MKKQLLAISLLLSPSFVAADQLERFEDVSNRMNALMAEMMAKEVDQAGGDGDIVRNAMPEEAWNDAVREAAVCILDRYDAAIGSDGIETMFDRMETLIVKAADMTITEFTESEEMDLMQPEGISEDDSIAFMQECGMIAAQSEYMSSTGFSSALMEAYGSVEEQE